MEISTHLRRFQHGRANWLYLLPVLIFVAYSLWLFDVGKRHGADELVDARQDLKTLKRRVSELKEEKKDLQKKLVVFERSSQIDQQANIGVRNEVVALQDELLGVRKELELYRGIIAPGDVRPGLRVQRLDLKPDNKQGAYQFDLTMTQDKRNGKYAQGVVGLEIIGETDGQNAVLVFNKLADNGEKPLHFKFRYFQHFQGQLRLPSDFLPRRIKVRLRPQGKKPPPAVDKAFDWPFQ